MEYVAGALLFVVLGVPVLVAALGALSVIGSLVFGFGPPWEDDWKD